jgi:ABC-type Fe3+ transport system permease subunit
MPQSVPNADTARALIILLAAVISLTAVVLKIVHEQSKEAVTPMAKRQVYRNAFGWMETTLWSGGLPASFLFGAAPTFLLWLGAFSLSCWMFVTSKDAKRLRMDIFNLVLGAQAVLAMGISTIVSAYIAQESRTLSLIEDLMHALTPK